jgi:hypothetical protein
VLEPLEGALWWLHIGDYLLVHGAFHPAMLMVPNPEAVSPRRTADKCRWLALYGEGKMSGGEDDLPARTYDWIDTVPASLTVIVGHDVISTEKILERRGTLGGRVLFCGCGKGGKLSFIDVPRPTIQALVLPGSIDKPPLGAHDPSL